MKKGIIEMAKEAGLEAAYPINHPMAKFIMAITARAEAKEREACAKVVESHGETLANGAMLAKAIRARGEA